MSLDPPRLLIDRRFVSALLAGDPDAVATYRDVIERFDREEILLHLLDADIAELQIPADVRRTLLAPAATMHVAGQHRSAAARATCPADMALDMVMIEWNHLRGIVTLDPRWLDYDVEVVGATATHGTDAASSEQAGVGPTVDL